MSANKTNGQNGRETAVGVLLFDVESFPNEGYTWGKWEQDAIEFTGLQEGDEWNIMSLR